VTWLLLIHQVPPKPDYLRVKVARRLQRIGALPIKNTVYLLPSNDATLEDLQWTVRDIRASGGDANLCEATFVDGLTDDDIQQRFNAARDADYAPLLAEARKKKPDAASIRTRMASIKAIDFFGARNGRAIETRLQELEKPVTAKRAPSLDLNGRVWVTRAGIHVDRMASAWLIARFIDPAARFRFVTGTVKPARNEVRFDMFDAEFTHEGDRCTFEVLVARAGLEDPALHAIGEIVHDIDLRDDKYGRPETAGVSMLVNGIALGHSADEERLRRASEAFDQLYQSLVSASKDRSPARSLSGKRGRSRPRRA
jgi:hypothetical protein